MDLALNNLERLICQTTKPTLGYDYDDDGPTPFSEGRMLVDWEEDISGQEE